MIECPYCSEDYKPRGLKNHVRLAGGSHGEAGEVPDDFDDRIAADEPDEPDDGESDDSDDVSGDSDVTTVTPDELADVHSDEAGADSDEATDSELPFDPDDPDAHRLDGGESMDIRTGDGEVKPGVTADEGDYLLNTEQGPVLYDHETGDMYEVLTL